MKNTQHTDSQIIAILKQNEAGTSPCVRIDNWTPHPISDNLLESLGW